MVRVQPVGAAGPALAELAQIRGAGDGAVYLDALIALYRGDFAAAESAARPALERAEQLYPQASEVARSDASVHEAAARNALYVFAAEGVVAEPFGGPEPEDIWQVQ